MSRILETSLVVTVGAMVGAAAAASQADVLYDTLWITDQLAYEDITANVYGGRGAWGLVEDVRLADDFVVDQAEYPDGFRIDSLTNDSATWLGAPPAEGVMVRLLADDGGYPGATIYEVLIGPDRVTSTPFDETVFGTIGQRLLVDTSQADLVLAPGTYWLNAQPYDTTPTGDAFWQLRDLDAVIGADTHFMWLWHGNVWGAMGDYWGRGAGTAAMRIEGVAVPGPAGVLLFSLAAFGGRRNRR
jgi:hypothetical protein